MSWFLFGVLHLRSSLVSFCSTVSSMELPHSSLVFSGPWFLILLCLFIAVTSETKNSLSAVPPPGKTQNLGCVIHSFFAPKERLLNCIILSLRNYRDSGASVSCPALWFSAASRQWDYACPSQHPNKWDRNKSFGHCSEKLEYWMFVPSLCLPREKLEFEVFWSSFHAEPRAGTVMRWRGVTPNHHLYFLQPLISYHLLSALRFR